MNPITFLKATFAAVGLLASFALCAATSSMPEKVYYRYENEQGVKVLDLSIPPKYAQKGYEIVNSAGQVLKVVPPAPTEEDIAKANAEREMRARYYELQKRYKSIEEIESAKRRRLANINTNISILNGNISGLKTQIENLASEAASIEREGRAVPRPLLQQIADAKAELAVAKDLLQIREEEYDDVEKQFNKDLAAFVQGSTLFNAQK